MSVIENIKELKRERKITAKELSEKSGVPIGTLNKILSGSTKSVKSETLSSICYALGVEPVKFLNGEEIDKGGTKKNDYGYIRVAAVTPKFCLGDVSNAEEEIKRLFGVLKGKAVNLAVFPELTLSGYTLSDLFYHDVLLKNCEKSLINIAEFSKNYDFVSFIGCPLKKGGKIFNTAVAVYGGEILAVIPKTYIPNYNEFYERRHFSPAEESNSEIVIGGKSYPFGTKIIIADALNDKFSVAAEICEDLWTAKSPSSSHAIAGANIIVNLSASDEIIGKAQYRRALVANQSSKCSCVYVYSDAGVSESTTDLIFSGHDIISENGKILTESEPFGDGFAISDVDLSFIEYERLKKFNYTSSESGYLKVCFNSGKVSDGTLRKYSRLPFVPTLEAERGKRADAILKMQSVALARRLSHTNAKTAVVGVSGGLDSTLALIVACLAMDYLKRSRKDVFAVTMPCFGTSERTKKNSYLLSEALGVTLKEVDITNTVLSHFDDIGHDGKTADVTYENAQARERTQVIMDLANATGGIVVGTGDLSELALGWATYNGDHMSMYGVNASIPKTLIRYIVARVAENSGKSLSAVLSDILDTPVSPELVPSKDGEISQKTEDIVGPYILHDFFLYHFIRNGFPPSKIYTIAKRTFDGEFSSEEIYKWLKTFIRRFFSQQFKRSCLPDGVKVGSVSLSPRGDLRMPSDASAALWLNDLGEYSD